MTTRRPTPGQRLFSVLGRGLLAVIYGAVFVFVLVGVSLLRDYHVVMAHPGQPRAVESLYDGFKAFGLPGGNDTTVELLHDPTQAWVARWRLITQARHSIEVAYFILDQDVFGVAFLGALLDRADHGVRVRILLDGLGTDMSRNLVGDDLLEELGSHPNVEVRVYRPLWQRAVSMLWSWRLVCFIASQHDKIIVVDGRWAITGGRNIAAPYFTPPAQPAHQFIDYDVLLESEVAARSLQQVFERLHNGTSADTHERANIISRRRDLACAYQRMDAWLRGIDAALCRDLTVREFDVAWRESLRAQRDLFGALTTPWPTRAVISQAQIADNTPHERPLPSEITEMFLTLIGAAQHEIIIVNPYLALGEDMVQALEGASRRGVAITLLTNSPRSSDNAMTQGVFLEQWPIVLARVPTARLFVVGGDDTLHAKVATFDQMLTLVGTYNLDPTAMRMSSELMVGIWSPAINRQARDYVAALLASEVPGTFEYRILRDERGRPVYSEEEPVVAFGPRNHLPLHQRAAAERYHRLMRPLRTALGISPLIQGVPGSPRQAPHAAGAP